LYSSIYHHIHHGGGLRLEPHGTHHSHHENKNTPKNAPKRNKPIPFGREDQHNASTTQIKTKAKMQDFVVLGLGFQNCLSTTVAIAKASKQNSAP
jgi:hypothetical protein